MNQENKSHLTAMSRRSPSRPMKLLDGAGMLQGEVLDYGSGRGYDADYYEVDSYDPYFRPNSEVFLNKYNTITCNYVLNVIDEKTGKEVVGKIIKMLHRGGSAYITVRRDLKNTDYYTSRGTFQRLVFLNLPIIYEDSDMCIYMLKINRKDKDIKTFINKIFKRGNK